MSDKMKMNIGQNDNKRWMERGRTSNEMGMDVGQKLTDVRRKSIDVNDNRRQTDINCDRHWTNVNYDD
jgi:hypothetical protein